MTSQQIGELEMIQHSMCKDCPHQELVMGIPMSGGDKSSIYCKHRDICNRIYLKISSKDREVVDRHPDIEPVRNNGAERHECSNCKYVCVSAWDIPCSDCCRGNGMENDHWVAKESEK